jgi:hypothetical protein
MQGRHLAKKSAVVGSHAPHDYALRLVSEMISGVIRIGTMAREAPQCRGSLAALGPLADRGTPDRQLCCDDAPAAQA